MTPSLSPSGDRIIFAKGDDSGTIRLWISSLSGGSPVRLTNVEAGAEFGGAWSPDGSRFSYLKIGGWQRMVDAGEDPRRSESCHSEADQILSTGLVAIRRLDHLQRLQRLEPGFTGRQTLEIPGRHRNSRPCVLKRRKTTVRGPDQRRKNGPTARDAVFAQCRNSRAKGHQVTWRRVEPGL